MSSLVKDIQTTDISEFQNELDRKDLIIKNLQNQLVNIKSQGQSLSSNNHIISELKSECLRKDKEIQILNEKIFELSTELKEANAKLDCYELKENFNKNESGNLLEISEIKIDKISKEKKLLEEKINQLIDIIRQYSNELNDSSIKIKNLNDDIFFLQNENRKLIDEKNMNKKSMNDFNNNINKYDQILTENNNNKSIIENLNKELYEYKMDYNNEINKNKSLNEKMITLVNKCNEYEKIQKTFKDASNDLLMAKKQITEINMRNQENEQLLNSLYNDINDNISVIIKYINKNFSINKNNNNNEISDLDYNNMLKKIDEVNFEPLLDTLELKKKEIYDFSNVISNGLEASDRENKILIDENEKLKEEINTCIFENKKLNSENIKLNNIINNINTDMINSKKNTEILRQKLNDINEEKDELNNRFINEINQNKDIFEKLKEDNTNLILMNNNLQDELQIMKDKDFENEQENNNLKLNCQILEKKIKGMQTELDLKNIQIQNQEEIISRRNDNNNSNILENDSAIIKKLKTDRDNLINDNVLLINQNNLLRQQLNEFSNNQENQIDNINEGGGNE
jgi:chromosome segregation ATPase